MRAARGRFLTGGTARARLFFPLSVLVDVTDGVRAVDEEQFGPILPIVRYHDPEGARTRQCQRQWPGRFGVVIGCRTRRRLGAAAAMRQRLGERSFDDFADDPFGGAKQSGIGVEFGQHGLDEYTQLQTVRIPR
jgi:acyl-CoA reductase-like NAD-dependent aldehyde dehydrogenase